MKMTLGTLLEEGKEKLEKAGVPDPLLDARFLLLDVFDMNFASFLVKRDRPLTETENGTNVTEADTDTRKKIDKYWEMMVARAAPRTSMRKPKMNTGSRMMLATAPRSTVCIPIRPNPWELIKAFIPSPIITNTLPSR